MKSLRPVLVSALITSSLLYAVGALAQKRIYIGPDDHTDLFWAAPLARYEQAFVETLDHYIARAEADIAAHRPTAWQSRWNTDGSLWLRVYERERSAAQFQRLIDLIGSGHISVPMNPVVSTEGGTPLEAVLRGLYYIGRIERQYGIDFDLAAQQENQTLPLGLASLWAGSGVRYSWKGVCDCGSLVPDAANRAHEIYWYQGRDRQQVLMKWYSQDRSGALDLQHPNQGPGGYAEARVPRISIDYVDTSTPFKERYPYDVIGLFGYGWDDLQTEVAYGETDERGRLIDFVAAAETLSDANREVIVSNTEDFFRDFASNHATQLPAQQVSYGNDWDLYAATLSEVSARMKRALEKLRAAEALASFVSLVEPSFMSTRGAQREQAFFNYGLYWEHGFGMEFIDPDSAAVAARVAWQRQLAREIEAYVDTLYEDAAARLAALIDDAGASESRFYVFNPVGWARTDFADLPYTGSRDVHVVDLSSGRTVPIQFVEHNARRSLRVLAELPALGYKVFAVRSGARSFSAAATIEGSTIDNGRFRVSVNDRGAIRSLIDTASGREYIQPIDGYLANDFGSGAGASVTTENVGPVSATLRVDVPDDEIPRSTRITLFRGSERIAIDNRIEAGFDTVRQWRFSFAIDEPEFWHEEVGALLRARLASAGGHYSDRANNTRYDWLTLNHFADMSGDGVGVTLSNADLYFMRVGHSDLGRLDTQTPQLSVLAGGEVVGSGYGLPHQGGDTVFTQRFALRAHRGTDLATAMRFAIEHQNPLLARSIQSDGSRRLPEREWSLLSNDTPDALIWTLKPAEEASRGLVVRLWNLAEQTREIELGTNQARFQASEYLSHIETPSGQSPSHAARSVRLTAGAQQLITLSLKMATAFDVDPPRLDPIARFDFEFGE